MRRRSIILALAVSATTLAVAQSIDTGVGLKPTTPKKDASVPIAATKAAPTVVTQDPTTGKVIPVAVSTSATPAATPAAASDPRPKLPSTPEELLNQSEPAVPATAATANSTTTPPVASAPPAASPAQAATGGGAAPATSTNTPPQSGILAVGTPSAGAGPTPAQLVEAEVRAAGDAAALPQPASKMNPYTGLSMATEALLRQLDAAKLETALLEERMKQQNLMAEMELLPARKRAEAATLVKDVRTEAKAIKAEQDGTGPPVAKATPKTAVKPKIAEPEIKAPPAPKIELMSLISGVNGVSAVVDLNGNTVVLREGEETPFGVMSVVDESTILLGKQRFSVHAHTLSRMVVSDPKPVDMKQRSSGGGTTATGLPLPPMIPSSSTLPNSSGAGTLGSGTMGTSTLRSVPPPLPTSN
jgi:hypothetical protein